MGKCLLSKNGGNGLDPDTLTATSGDVLKGKLAGVSGSDEPVSGTMSNNGAVSQSLNAGGSYTIPAGYHNGSGKVTANSLSSQTSANATASQILSGQTAWVNGSKVTGSMPNRGTVNQALGINGSYTIPTGYHNGSGKVTQSVATQGGSTTAPGTANKTIVSANRYVTGNIIVAGSSNLTAGNIKKGVNIFGVTGSWEGWIAASTDLYKNGINSAGFTNNGSSGVTFESGSIKMQDTMGYLYSSKSYNLSPYSTLKIEYMYTSSSQPYDSFNLLFNSASLSRIVVARSYLTRRTISLDIKNINITCAPTIECRSIERATGSGSIGRVTGYIYRIYLE